MPFDSKECAWAQTKIVLFGRTITGIRGFSFSNTQEKEHLFAAGNDPIGIQSGNKAPKRNIKILKYEFDLLQDAAQLAGFDSISDVPHTGILITCSYKKDITDKLRIVEASGVAFSDWDVAMEQNAKMTDMTLPWIALTVKTRVGGV